ncbi:hypothetical protein B9G69_007700 [Bdellovibrio sp. SKB1291214]|uniref:hypothetical protein n=1 Tax=Bdellovibrio sp. SKB1291214 TaxID=1732569 RepID=UPI0020CE2F1B|nr:hypothetical protein [Bdellovibrio sp. SKB1291214]UYL10462.1 hypothetical protein B9G69_007700 [Bdellovibrio sp. SKB1291214]
MLITFFSANALADNWRLTLERAGFMGTMALGGSYEWLPEHAVNFSVGGYHIDKEIFYQSNLSYRYSRWNTGVRGNLWRPLQFGVFASYALNQDRFFLKSPDKYPSPGYYDETALRYGLELASTMTFMPSHFAIGYHLRIFDTGIIAMFNNDNKDIQYYISSGISLQYLF